MSEQTIINFKENPSTKNWFVVDDVVMGGKSLGKFSITDEGVGMFSGQVSLENNGGFSSVRLDIDALAVTAESRVKIKLKGDGSTYQFRIKDTSSTRHSYTASFTTTGTWETFEFTLADLHPIFRGNTLDLPNFDKTTLAELRFLIANKKAQNFELLIASITLK